MTVWWVPGETGELTRAVICVPGPGDETQMRQALAHCCRRGYGVVAVSGGRAGWHSARRMLQRRDADVVVTVPGGPPPGDGVEVAQEVQP